MANTNSEKRKDFLCGAFVVLAYVVGFGGMCYTLINIFPNMQNKRTRANTEWRMVDTIRHDTVNYTTSEIER